MKICKAKDGQPVEIQEIPASFGNISTGGRFLPEMQSAGWRLYEPCVTPNIKASHWEDTEVLMVQAPDSIYSAEELAQQAADAAAAQAKSAAEQAAKDAETKALEDAQKAALDKAKAGIDGKIEDRVANIETILGLRKATAP